MVALVSHLTRILPNDLGKLRIAYKVICISFFYGLFDLFYLPGLYFQIALDRFGRKRDFERLVASASLSSLVLVLVSTRSVSTVLSMSSSSHDADVYIVLISDLTAIPSLVIKG